MKIEQLIEKMIIEGKIKQEDLDAMIERGKANSPIPAIKEDIVLTQAQSQAITDRADFIEEVIAEIAMMVYS